MTPRFSDVKVMVDDLGMLHMMLSKPEEHSREYYKMALTSTDAEAIVRALTQALATSPQVDGLVAHVKPSLMVKNQRRED